MKQTTSIKADFKGFAVSYLDESVKAQIKAMKKDPKALFDWIFTVSLDGYKFALQSDEAGEVFQASLYARFKDSENAGLMLSMRHTDPIVAIQALQIYHEEVTEGKWHKSESVDW